MELAVRFCKLPCYDDDLRFCEDSFCVRAMLSSQKCTFEPENCKTFLLNNNVLASMRPLLNLVWHRNEINWNISDQVLWPWALNQGPFQLYMAVIMSRSGFLISVSSTGTVRNSKRLPLTFTLSLARNMSIANILTKSRYIKTARLPVINSKCFAKMFKPALAERYKEKKQRTLPKCQTAVEVAIAQLEYW